MHCHTLGKTCQETTVRSTGPAYLGLERGCLGRTWVLTCSEMDGIPVQKEKKDGIPLNPREQLQNCLASAFHRNRCKIRKHFRSHVNCDTVAHYRSSSALLWIAPYIEPCILHQDFAISLLGLRYNLMV